MRRDSVNASELALKKYGQNFLKDRTIISKIIQAMPNDCNNIVEIGPGLGDLTTELVRVGNVTAFEVDERLCKILRDEFSNDLENGSFRLVCGDVMKRWQNGSLLEQEYCLIANLPYYIATNLILKALRDPNCRYILVMVQKEVAQKFSAVSNQRDFCALSILAQSSGEAKLLFEVPPTSFEPPPKVTSAILEIKKIESKDDREFENFLKVAFSQPRKKLIKNLSKKYPKDRLSILFETLEIDSNIRPHEATTSLYHRLYNELKKDKEDGREKEYTKRQ